MAHEMTIPKTAPALLRNVSLETDEIWQARADLAACLRMAARLGLEEGICNHFSAVVPGHPDLFLVNRLGWAFQEATASSLLICDFEGHVIAGDGVSAAVHALAHAMNAALGNVGETVTYTPTAESRPSNQLADLRTLVADMNAGSVDFLLVLGGNPVFTAPSAAGFGVSKPAISKHLKVLEESGVVTRVIRGRTHQLSLDTHALGEAADWMDRQRALWERLFDVVDEYLKEDVSR